MNVKIVMAMIAATVALGVSQTASAQLPPPPPGVVLRPGWTWCPKCGGHGSYERHWYGLRKTCSKCDGVGMIKLPPPPPRHVGPKAPPPPPRHVGPKAPPPPPRHVGPKAPPPMPVPPVPHAGGKPGPQGVHGGPRPGPQGGRR